MAGRFNRLNLQILIKAEIIKITIFGRILAHFRLRHHVINHVQSKHILEITSPNQNIELFYASFSFLVGSNDLQAIIAVLIHLNHPNQVQISPP